MKTYFNKLLSLCLSAILIAFGIPLTSGAVQEDYVSSKLYINDYYVHDLPHEFIIKDGVSMIAFSDLTTAMLSPADYNADMSEANLNKPSRNANITFTVDKLTAVNNEKEFKLRMAPFKKDGDIYVPLKEFCEQLKYEVEYVESENAVYIYTYKKELIQAMKPFNDNCTSKEVIDWLIGQYDPEIGGFYYAGSSRDYPQFSTHIEPTYQGFAMLYDGKIGGIYNRDMSDILPDDVKERLGKYIQNAQSDLDGYFYDWWCADESTTNSTKKSRDLSWSQYLLDFAGVEPLYLLPKDRITGERLTDFDTATLSASKSTILDRYSSKSAMLSWLNSLDWSDSYTSGNQVAAAASMIKQTGHAETVGNFLTELQNKETGMWQDGYNYYSCNGVMKIAAFYNTAGVPFPNPDKAIMSILKTLEGDDIPETACEVWNVIDAIDKILLSNKHQVSPETKQAIDTALLDIMDLTLNSMKRFKKDDGGYSYYPWSTQTKINGVVAALGLPESEMDATRILTVNMRNSFYSLMGSSIIPPIYDKYRDDILSRLSNAPKVQKIEIPTGFSYDMEDSEVGILLPQGIGKGCQQGKVDVTTDPLNINNKVLRFVKVVNSSDQMSMTPYFNGDISDITFECDMYVEQINAGASYYNGIELKSGVQWCVSSTDAMTFNLSMRPNENGIGAILKSGLETGKWHRIKIRYQPDGIRNTVVTMFHNGQIIGRTSSYFNGGNASALPATKIQNITFNGFKSAGGTIYFDNIKLYENK